MAALATCPPLTRDSVLAAHELIKPHVHETPVLTSRTLNALASTPQAHFEGAAAPVLRLWFKCENLQRTGAFKARGAFHAVERLKRDEEWVAGGGMAKGVVTHSSGNHAAALALAARESGIPAHVVMPAGSAPPKIAATRGYGARVVFCGATAPEREAAAAAVVRTTGARLVPPFDHPDIMLGQGTVAIEFQAQVAARMAAAAAAAAAAADGPRGGASGTARGAHVGLDAIITPCGGGGLLSGVALACEGTGITVFGAEPEFEGADDCKRGLAAGARVAAVQSRTIADGLRTPVGALPWGVIAERRLVRALFGAGEAQIAAALRLLLARLKLVVEPSAAVALAAVLCDEGFRRLVAREAGAAGWDVGVVLSGGNVALEQLGALLGAA